MNIIRLTGLCVTFGLLGLHNQVVFSAEQDGVRCPTGKTASYLNGDRTLKCSSVRVFIKASICPPINAPLNIIPAPSGSDRCLAPVVGNPVPSAMAPLLPGDPPTSSFQRVISQNGMDRFEARVTTFSFPTGAFYSPFANASLGVTCPSDFSPRRTSNNNLGLLCFKLDGGLKSASCDSPFVLKIDKVLSRLDRCEADISGNTVLGPTKPMGLTKIAFDLDQARGDVSWALVPTSGLIGIDRWQRTIYKFPTSN